MNNTLRQLLVKVVGPVRAPIIRCLKPKADYFLATRSLQPISTKFGFDRGKPIDRYFIEKFLAQYQKDIRGRCLEVVDNTYTKRFGGVRVRMSEVIDNNPQNTAATIHGDLRDMHMIPNNTFDCLIITHTLGMVDDLDSAIAECYRVLKSGGVLLATVSCFSPVWEAWSMWRFTVKACTYLFGKKFKKDLKVRSYGNVLVGQCFWVGMAVEDLQRHELEYDDPHFPCIIAVRAKKV